MKEEAGMNNEAKKLKRERVGEWRKRDRRPKGGHTEAQIDRNRVDGRLNSSNRPTECVEWINGKRGFSHCDLYTDFYLHCFDQRKTAAD